MRKWNTMEQEGNSCFWRGQLYHLFSSSWFHFLYLYASSKFNIKKDVSSLLSWEIEDKYSRQGSKTRGQKDVSSGDNNNSFIIHNVKLRLNEPTPNIFRCCLEKKSLLKGLYPIHFSITKRAKHGLHAKDRKRARKRSIGGDDWMKCIACIGFPSPPYLA